MTDQEAREHNDASPDVTVGSHHEKLATVERLIPPVAVSAIVQRIGLGKSLRIAARN